MDEIRHDAKNADPELLEAFRRYEAQVAIANVKLALALGGVFMLMGWSLDWVVFPRQIQAFFIIRFLCALLLGAIYLSLGRTPGPKTCYFASLWASILPMISICVMIAMTGGGNSVYYAGLNLILVGLSLVLRWTFRNSLLIVASCFVAYSTGVLLSPGQARFSHRLQQRLLSFRDGGLRAGRLLLL